MLRLFAQRRYGVWTCRRRCKRGISAPVSLRCWFIGGGAGGGHSYIVDGKDDDEGNKIFAEERRRRRAT